LIPVFQSDCANLTLVGNGLCNDLTNIPECDFDGGDCCGSCITTEFCSECQCHGEYIDTVILNPLVGNGYCNDITNNAGCNYDGGDCCGTCINTEQCLDCECKDEILGNGIHNALVGNGFCDDETNYPNCNYDGFECCGWEINTVSNPGTYHEEYSCIECLCKGKYTIQDMLVLASLQ
jgi:hypothetical protein